MSLPTILVYYLYWWYSIIALKLQNAFLFAKTQLFLTFFFLNWTAEEWSVHSLLVFRRDSRCAPDLNGLLLLPYQENGSIRGNYSIPAVPVDSRIMLCPYFVNTELESALQSSQSKETRQNESKTKFFCFVIIATLLPEW